MGGKPSKRKGFSKLNDPTEVKAERAPQSRISKIVPKPKQSVCPPAAIDLLDVTQFKEQMEGTILDQLPPELLSVIIACRPARVGRFSTEYRQKLAFSENPGGLISPWSIILRPHGGVIVTGHSSHCVHVFSEQGDDIQAIALSNSAGDSPCPIGVCLQTNGNLIVSEYTRTVVKMLLPDGTVHKIISQSGSPYSVATDALDQIYVCDRLSKEIKIYDSEGEYMKALSHENLESPAGISIGVDGTVVVVDNNGFSLEHGRLFVFDPSGQFRRQWNISGGCFTCATDCVGNIMTVSQTFKMTLYSPEGHVIKKFDDKEILRAGGFEIHPMCVAVDVTGDLYITDYNSNTVIVWSPV